MDFKYNDISSEDYREYVSSDGGVYRVDSPVGLYISVTGTHYVKDVTGVVHALTKPSFMAVRWSDPKKGTLFVNPTNPNGPTFVNDK